MSAQTNEVQAQTSDAPASQSVAIPTVSQAVRNTLRSLTPDGLAEAAKTGKLAQYASRASGAYAAMGTLEKEVSKRRTVTGAYVHRAMRLDGKLPGEIGTVLGLSSGRVTQLGNVARIVFDLGVPENYGDFGAMTGKLLNSKPFRDELNRKDCTAESLMTLADSLLRPKASVGGSDAEDSGSGQATDDTRGSSNSGQTFERWNSNTKRLDNLESLLAALTDLSPAEWQRLFTFSASVSDVLAASGAKGPGVALVKAEAEKTKVTQQSAE